MSGPGRGGHRAHAARNLQNSTSRTPTGAETALWRAVILQAVRDAATGDDAARGWLLRGGADFRDVCEYAGLDHGWVLRAAQKMQSDGWRRLTRPQ